MSTDPASRDDQDASSSDAAKRPTSDENESGTDGASSRDDEPNEVSDGPGGRPSPDELEEELERLRAEVTRLRARQAAAVHASWFHRHPGWALFVTTALGAAAGYLAAQVGAPDDAFSEKTRQQLRHLAEQARDVASDVQHEIEARTRPFRDATDDGDAASSAGDGASAGTRTTAEDAAIESRSLAEEAVDRMVGSARKARTSVQERARSATQDAAQRAVRSFASDDDVVPVELKAKAAGMAASTLGAALARKLLRSAGRVATSMILAYLTKKVLDVVRGR